MNKPYIPALIFSLIILGCFLLGALIDKYFRMKAMREFARRYREAQANMDSQSVRHFHRQNFAPLHLDLPYDPGILPPPWADYSPTDSIDSPQPITHIANGEAP